MSVSSQPDLEEIRSKFKNFRAGRKGKERLPEELWAIAIGLLEHYPLRVVCRELRLKPEYLKQRAEALEQGRTDKFKFDKRVQKPRSKRKPKLNDNFLSITANDLRSVSASAELMSAGALTSECRVMIERTDGSRLTLTVPIDWSRIEALCAHFLRV
jgi:hypothetical protein